jgi:hypothetical protein
MSDIIARSEVISPEKQSSMNIAAGMYELQAVETLRAEPAITKGELTPEEWTFDGNYGHKSIAEFTVTGVDITGGSPVFKGKNGPSTWMGWGYNHGEFTSEDATFAWAKENGHLATDATPADMNVYGNRVGINITIDDVNYSIGDMLGVENYAYKETEQSVNVDAELQERYGFSLSDEQKQNVTFTLEHHTIRWGSLDVEEVTVETAVPATTTTTSTTTSTVPETTTTSAPVETTTTTTIPEVVTSVPETSTTIVVETTTTTPEIVTTVPEVVLGPPVSIVREPETSVSVTIVEQPELPRLPRTGGESGEMAVVATSMMVLGGLAILAKRRLNGAV